MLRLSKFDQLFSATALKLQNIHTPIRVSAYPGAMNLRANLNESKITT